MSFATRAADLLHKVAVGSLAAVSVYAIGEMGVITYQRVQTRKKLAQEESAPQSSHSEPQSNPPSS
ncbi:hypothetical protein M427DRAFT_28458 [Gonapodya prolifera JEL478]|uniref:Uncharacterized protein n=1 Tax=Gonapodya prolifera (strain JEL478) TaxID=1344416 RepID=A0A139AUJ4_GONPJ|nr:hypothetical protein M427DRAFT_28458 [Gonapodya prolifera JEL478]|eukprot:KXS20155.1 hypothetical protein M427DRAFT_28458 [Gonapodya prolifera JEL478]